MRTFLVVFVMLLLAFALMAGFLMPVAGAQAPLAANLTVDCDGEAVAASVPVVRSCIVKVANTGAAPIAGARVDLQPAPSGAIPDRYYFWDARLDGRALDVSPGQLSYEVGDVSPGATRTLELSVIVESAHPYAATAVLRSNTGDQLDAELIAGDVSAPAPALVMFVSRVITKDATGMAEADPPGTYRLSLNIRNGSHLPIDSVDGAVEVSGATVESSGGWHERATRAGGEVKRYATTVPGTAGDVTSVPFTVAGFSDPCGVQRPVARATVHLAGGGTMELASFAEELEFPCAAMPGFGGGGDVTTLPSGGDGSGGRAGQPSVVASLLLAASAAVAGASVVLVGVGRASRR
jgi:hypothetical protein